MLSFVNERPMNENEQSVYSPIFEESEYKIRYEKVITNMIKNNFDVLIVSSPDNIFYLTGYDGWSFYVPQYVVIFQKSEIPYLIIREMDSASGKTTTYLPQSHILSYQDDYVDSMTKHPIHLVCELISCRLNVYPNTTEYLNSGILTYMMMSSYKEHYLEKIIAIDMDSDYCRAKTVYELQEHMYDKKYEIVNDNKLVNWIRIVKSHEELKHIRKAASIADAVMLACLQNIGTNVTQGEIAAIALATQAKHGTYTAIAPMIMVNEQSAHMNWKHDQKFNDNDKVCMELAASYNHYHCPIARTYYVGEKIPDDMITTAKSVHKAMQAALDVCRQGNTAEDIYNAFNQIMSNEVTKPKRRHDTKTKLGNDDTKHGFIKQSRLAYSFGIGYPPDWGEKTLSARPHDKTILQPFMCLHLIAGCGDGLKYEYSEAIIIQENHKYPELLCKTPRGIFNSNMSVTSF